jgi:hypothetical protein
LEVSFKRTNHRNCRIWKNHVRVDVVK